MNVYEKNTITDFGKLFVSWVLKNAMENSVTGKLPRNPFFHYKLMPLFLGKANEGEEEGILLRIRTKLHRVE